MPNILKKYQIKKNSNKIEGCHFCNSLKGNWPMRLSLGNVSNHEKCTTVFLVELIWTVMLIVCLNYLVQSVFSYVTYFKICSN